MSSSIFFLTKQRAEQRAGRTSSQDAGAGEGRRIEGRRAEVRDAKPGLLKPGELKPGQLKCGAADARRIESCGELARPEHRASPSGLSRFENAPSWRGSRHAAAAAHRHDAVAPCGQCRWRLHAAPRRCLVPWSRTSVSVCFRFPKTVLTRCSRTVAAAGTCAPAVLSSVVVHDRR